jgi:prostaglandin-H2 D-isomerase / glutathione transferase
MLKLTLNYFNIRARGELARLILIAGGIKFNDRRITKETWPTEKLRAPTGKLPYLEVNDTKIPQSIAISRYAAKLANLNGKDELEQAKTDSLVDTCNELMNSYFTSVFRAENKETAYAKFLNDTVHGFLAQLENLITLYGKNGYSVGNSLTWSDLFIYEVCSQLLKNNHIAILSKYPAIEKVCNHVNSNPRIANYVKNRQPTPY